MVATINRKVVRKDLWKRNQRKTNRAEGIPYVTKRGVEMPARTIGRECSCLRECFTVINETIRQAVLVSFNTMASKILQDTYLMGLITINQIKRHRPRIGDREAKSFSYTYHIRRGVSKFQVCRDAFCSMHGISAKRVKLIAMKSANSLPLYEQRGKHNNRANKIPEETRRRVHEHILSFPSEPSHYSREENHGKEYLAPGLDITKMHTLYKEKFPGSPISYDFYFRYFHANFNLRFTKPKSDTCETCDQYANKLKWEMTSEERTQLLKERDHHQTLAATFFTDIKDKFQKAKETEDVEAICYDFQQNMPLPKIPSTDVFYKRQLWVHNFGVSSGKTSRTHCYMYDESVAKKSSNEPISFLKHYIEVVLSPTIRTLYIFSDNCVAQNKNHALTQFLFYQVQCGRFDQIIQRFPEPGHSFMPCDRSFGIIEKNLRKTERVFVPEDYMRIVKNTSKKFDVISVNREMVFNMVEHLAGFFPNIPKICNGQSRKKKFLITKPRLFVYDKKGIEKGTILVGTGIDDQMDTVNLYCSGNIGLTGAACAYLEPLKIKALKFRDVQSLAQKYVAPSDIEFYNSLMSQ